MGFAGFGPAHQVRGTYVRKTAWLCFQATVLVMVFEHTNHKKDKETYGINQAIVASIRFQVGSCLYLVSNRGSPMLGVTRTHQQRLGLLA